jgi:hypothetical protein
MAPVSFHNNTDELSSGGLSCETQATISNNLLSIGIFVFRVQAQVCSRDH